MADKEIIIYKKECYNEPYCSLNQVLEQLKAKEQECEELKEKINSLLCSENCYKYKQAEKYRQTLTEIKEIAEYCYDPVDKENDGFWSILQKISECEVEE